MKWFRILLVIGLVGCSTTQQPAKPRPTPTPTPVPAQPKKTLTWDARPASEHVTSYKVYRNNKLAATVTVTSYPNAKPGTYYVTAVNASGESAHSNTVNL